MSFTVSLFAKCRLLGNSKVTTDIMYSFNLRFVLQRSLSKKNDYEEAVEKLNYLQSNSTVLKQCQQRVARGLNSRSNSDTKMYLKRIGITAEEIDSGLSVIHVSGTKGKGSTCAYCESVLRQYGYKTGFYSSPHLVAVRERIRINGQPLSESDFAYYFWDVYTKLEANRDDYNGAMPFYFSFLTVMAIRIFLAEKVDVAIIEVGIGGENDSTNIFSNTPVVGITSLGLDHTTLLGDTVDKIAWQKAGIMKKKSIAITASNQPAAALKVLYDRAKEKQCVLLEAPSIAEYKWNSNSELSDLNLSGTINPINASVGLQLAYAWLTKCKNRGSLENIGKGFKLEEESIEGIKNCFWPGRQQIITRRKGDFKYFIDGAHTVESMSECSYWFKEQTKGENSTRVLLFNITSDRDALSLLKPLLSCYFDVAIFCTNIATNRITNSSDLANLQTTVERQIQRTKENALIWIETNQKHIMDNDSKEKVTKTFDTVEESVHFIENLSGKNNVLVTGSLHLIGAFFSVIGPDLILRKSNGVN